MKRFVLFVIIVSVLLVLVGCGNSTETVSKETEPVEKLAGFDYIDVQGKITVIEDLDTGVQYLVCKYGGMVERVNMDGTLCTLDHFTDLKYIGVSGHFTIIEDVDTGVQYIVAKNGGIAKRLNSDGTLYGSDNYDIDYVDVSGYFTVIEDTDTNTQYIVAKNGGMTERLETDNG